MTIESSILLPSEHVTYYSGSTEPEYEDWWNQFGPALDADSRMSREAMAFAGFCAGIHRGRKETHELRAKLLAQAAQLETVRQENWQPIDTAPKDGTVVLLWLLPATYAVDPHMVISRWIVPSLPNWPPYWQGANDAKPTHWMPLPIPPPPPDGEP